MNIRAVLVTGGAGFIGSHVVDQLVEAGFKVKVADNLSTGKLSNIENHLATGRASFIKCDVRNQDEVQAVTREVDTVVHLAAMANIPQSFEQPSLTFATNVDGTANLLTSCIEAHVKKLVFISSCSVYGEPKYLPIDENHPLSANSPYAASKIAAEKLCQDFCRQKGLDVVILRLFNVYGPRQATSPYGGVIAKWVYRMSRKLPLVVFGDGSQTRDFVCVYDVAGAVLRVLRVDEVGGETFNIGSGRAVSMNELAKDLLSITNADLHIMYEGEKAGDVKASLASIAKAREVLGYEPMVDLETGLRSMFQTEVK